MPDLCENSPERHERCRRAAHTVVDRSHLGHGRHLDDPGSPAGRDAADQDADHDQDVIAAFPALAQERRQDRDAHAECRELIAPPRTPGRTQELETKDEEDSRDQVGDVDDRRSTIVDHDLSAPVVGAPAPEHLEHAVGHHERSKDVGGAEDHGQKADQLQPPRISLAEHHHAAEQHDAMDGIRAGHQRCVQRGRNPPDQFHSKEDREQEDVDSQQYAVIHPSTPNPSGPVCPRGALVRLS